MFVHIINEEFSVFVRASTCSLAYRRETPAVMPQILAAVRACIFAGKRVVQVKPFFPC